MLEISPLVKTINDIAERYGLKILYIDETDVTLISRLGFPFDAFIQIYANTKKEKLNMALVVADERLYGVDKEGGFYHEHPSENPLLHTSAEQIEIEDFVIRCINLLKKIGLL